VSGVSLSQLLRLAEIPFIQSDLAVDPVISSLATDSRKVEPNSLFVSVKGTKSDGSKFIEEAIARGAVALVGEGPVNYGIGSKLPQVEVADARDALAHIANAFFGEPFNQTLNMWSFWLMNAAMIGITFALVFAGILQTHLQRVLEMGYMNVQSQIELFYWLRLGSGVCFIIGALMFIYAALGPVKTDRMITAPAHLS